MRSEKADVIIVGAGIFGLLTARELKKAGLDVLLLDSGQPGREASRASAGILSPLYPWRVPAPVQALANWSQQYYPVLADDLRRETGLDPELTNSGMLVFDENEQQVALAWARYSARPLDYLDPTQLEACEPGLAGSLARHAVFLPTVAHIHSSRLMRALTESTYGNGIPIREETPVEEIRIKGGKVAGVRTPLGDFDAERVIVSAGAWSGKLLAESGLKLDIRPVRGQIIQFDGPPGLLSRILLAEAKYILPRRSGRLVVGSTLEEAGFDKGTTEEGLEELRAAAVKLLPALESLPVQRQWAGLRPATQDDLPYIGLHPDVEGLYLNAGHFRHGMTTAPASARLLADMLLEKSPILDPSAYRPGR